MPSSGEKKRQKSNDGSPVVTVSPSDDGVLDISDDKARQEVVDEILYNVIWKSSDAAAVEEGLDKLANFCFDGEEAKAYRLILCQDRRLSVATSAMIEWAENPVVISVACTVITNALASKEVDMKLLKLLDWSRVYSKPCASTRIQNTCSDLAAQLSAIFCCSDVQKSIL